MRFSEMGGSRQLKVIGKLMTLADGVRDEPAFKAFMESVRDGGGSDALGAVLKLGPLLERDDVASGLVGVVACGKGVSAEQAEELDVISEVMELLTDDAELPSFLSGRP